MSNFTTHLPVGLISLTGKCVVKFDIVYYLFLDAFPKEDREKFRVRGLSDHGLQSAKSISHLSSIGITTRTGDFSFLHTVQDLIYHFRTDRLPLFRRGLDRKSTCLNSSHRC